MMSDPAPDGSSSTPLPGFDRAIAARFARLTGGFWKGVGARAAWTLTFGLAGFLVLKLIVDVGTNRWNRWFFDALERRDGVSAALAVLAFAVLVACVAAVGVGIVLARERLQVRWREWCTTILLDGWLKNQRFHRLTAADSPLQNPEYRISDDVRMATEPLTDFAIGIFTALLAAATFAGILWSVGGSLDVPVGGVTITIPAFMVIGAVLYGCTVSGLIPIVGARLTGAAAVKNEAEARFRFEMIRLRENSEGVILGRGEAEARRRLDLTYGGLVRAWLDVVRQHGRVTWVMNANSAMVPVVPLVLCAPKYLSGQLSLGEVMQLASAFVQVQMAIAWLVDNYWRIAEWFASARRVVELVDAYEVVDASVAGGASLVERGDSEDGALRLTDLRLTDQTGRVVLEHATLVVQPGEKVMIAGEPGTGKSVLVRALSGLWPWGAGEIRLPADCTLAFVSGQPFLVAGSLREALTYPMANAMDDADLRTALTSSGLPALAQRLDDVARWDQTLSASERQRLAIARLLAQRPQIMVLEDAVSALDDAAQAEIMDTLFAACAGSAVIVVGGRPALATGLDRLLIMQRSASGGAILTETDVNGRTHLSVVGENFSRRNIATGAA